MYSSFSKCFNFTNLKSDLSDITGCEKLIFTDGYYIATNGDVVDINTKVQSSTGLAYCIVDCTDGDIFTISGVGGDTARLWCFIDDDGNSLSVALKGRIEENLEIIAPSNASKLIINSWENTNCYKGLCGKALVNNINSINENLNEKVDRTTIVISDNRLRTDNYNAGYVLNHTNGELYSYSSTEKRYVSDYLDIFTNVDQTKGLIMYVNMGVSWLWGRYAFYDKDKIFISGGDSYENPLSIPQGAYYMRVYTNYYLSPSEDSQYVNVNGENKYAPYSYVEKNTVPSKTSELENDSGFITDADIVGNHWKGKVWSAYGDSITAISNGDGLQLGWAKYVNDVLGFSAFYGRGIGGQKYAWGNAGGGVSFINADGTYNSRNDSYNKDNYTGDIPDGTVACRSAFCSWDRITHMYPESIKDMIDLIFIMGGTNDSEDETAPVFASDNTTDVEWASSDYYTTYGGDYNISTLKGGLASCVMKMQAWMPQAIIVIGTPLSGRGSTGVIGTTLGVGEYMKSEYIKETAKMCSIPLIDVYATCGINPWNRTKYISDSVHPYLEDGKKMLARAIIGGLVVVYPMIA